MKNLGKKTWVIIGVVILVVFGYIVNDRIFNSVDEKLEPIIIKVSGLMMYTEESEILSIVQYYNESEGIHYYEVEFGYKYVPHDSDELTYVEREAVIIINHNHPGDFGDFYFTSELELEKNDDIRDHLEFIFANYEPIATYDKDELVLLTKKVLDKNGYSE